MADGVAITAGSGTTIATDDIAGVHYQRVKPVHGADGSATDTSAAAPLPVQSIPGTTNGCTLFYRNSSADTNAANIKASAGKVYSITATNTNASVRYLRLYNASGSPTVGTTSTVFKVALPAGGGVHLSFECGLNFSSGIAMSLTTGAADTDTGAVAANELAVNIGYV